jgi:hypothetical protein
MKDMMSSIEHFIFDGESFRFDAAMSAASIKAMTSTTSYLTPVGITIPLPSTSLTFVDGIGDATLTLSDADEWLVAGQQEHFGKVYDAYFHVNENILLLTHGFDDLL